MIAIDTNVLLRYLLQDDELQARKSTKFIHSHPSVFVSHIVLAETAWTLAGKRYRATATDIATAIGALFEEESFILQDAPVVWNALADYRLYAITKQYAIDFPDVLIYHVGKDAAEYENESFVRFYTFDKAARKLPNAYSP